MNRKELEEKYLRAKYEYYILAQPTMLDSDYDKLEATLRNMGSIVVDLVDFPTIKEIKKLGLNVTKILDKTLRDEKKYAHLTPMLSLQKIQVNDEDNMPFHELELFFDRVPKGTMIEGGSKYDGNGQELIYRNCKLSQALTRGDKKHGFDKTDKMKYLVPIELQNADEYLDKTIEIRGEVVIDVKLWEERYSDPDKVDNARNFVAGVLNRDEYNRDDLKDLVYIAYNLVIIDEKTGEKSFPNNSMVLLEKFGFNNIHKPIMLYEPATKEGFLKIYENIKNYRENICPYLIDGIVLKFPEDKRLKLGENHHEPKWAVAIKFPSKEVSTRILDVEWSLGKDGSLTPIAILEPVELLGTIVKKTSLSNLGTMYKKKTYISSVVVIKKSGEIIPMVTSVLTPSPNEKEYDKQIEDFMKKSK